MLLYLRPSKTPIKPMHIKICTRIVLLKYLFTITVLCITVFAQAQTKASFTTNTTQTFNTANAFIENMGQYGTTYKGQENMGSILYGFEGHNMPILFTKRGLIFLQRKVERISKAEEEKLEKQGVSEEEIERKKIVTDRAITMEWVGANSNVAIIQEEKTYEYHTYGLLKDKAHGYKKITYKNLYNGIDLEYSFTNNSKIGFEYSLHVAAGADLSQIQMRYGGDAKTIKTNKQGNLIIDSDIEGIEQSIPISFYNETTSEQRTTENGQQTTNNLKRATTQLKTAYKITNNQITFTINENYDHTKPIVIDPFISSTGNLDGLNAGKAKDIDYDYAGNVYVTGGGTVFPGNHRLAKYNAAGVLQWTFSGVLTTPIWQFGDAFGGWVVEKPTGNIYLGQGADINGFRVIRLNTNGLYDNYITIADANFIEDWKMFWGCNNGNAQILIGGGGGTSNINIATLISNSTSLSPINITGIPYISNTNGGGQDIVDAVIDPINNELFTFYASSVGTPVLNNKIYKNVPPYSALTVAWNIVSGFNTIIEGGNRPYLLTNLSGVTDNSANILALNPNYLFYWDGKNLKAFNKATGATAGTPLITTNTAKMTGGIYADGCNNVYVGNVNGTIKVYNFNGTIFNDAPADITIAGYPTKSVYDISYNEADKLLYASGDGFVASIDISNTCATTTTGYSLNIVTNCIAANATATVLPTPPIGALVAYTLYIGNTAIASNSTGVFTNLLPQTNYKIIAAINPACSGIQLIGNFTLPASILPTATTSLSYCQGTTAQALTATGTNLQWYTSASGGGTGSSTAPIPSTAAVGSTTYYVSQTTAGNCESQRLPITVTIVAAPAAPSSNNILYCQGAIAIPLTATGTNLLWYTSATGTIGTTTAPIPTTAAIGSTNYYVSQTVNTCESQRATINVNITPALFANAGNTITIAGGGSTQLQGSATAGADYTWSSSISPISLNNIKILNPIANPTQTTTYLLTVKDLQGNCPTVSSSVQVVVVQNCINIRNAFTPNGDGINDKWLVYDQAFCLAPDGASVQVFNRYGSKVYENKAYKNTWDGTYNNKSLPDGTYYAVIVFTLFDGRKQFARSDVTIMR
jgi:gliding motility-associated-like protein